MVFGFIILGISSLVEYMPSTYFTISKILKRNIDSIKKIAEKEGISVNKLIQYFKKSE